MSFMSKMKFFVLGGLIGVVLVGPWRTKSKNNMVVSQANEEIQKISVSKRGQGYGVLLLETDSIEEAEVTSVDVKKTVGEIDLQVISPKIILTKIDPTDAIRVVGKFHISGAYFNKIEEGLVQDESDIEWIRKWNSD